MGGPVLIPKLYNGHNRTFFFADYQGTRQNTSAGNNITDVETFYLNSQLKQKIEFKPRRQHGLVVR